MTVGKAADAISPSEGAVDILSQLAPDHTLSETLGKLAKAHEAGGRAVDASAAWGLAKEICVTLDDRAGASEAAEHEVRLRSGNSRITGGPSNEP